MRTGLVANFFQKNLSKKNTESVAEDIVNIEAIKCEMHTKYYSRTTAKQNRRATEDTLIVSKQ
jgi:hypothetical protein